MEFYSLAKDIWDDIKLVLDREKVPKICNLRKAIANLTQDYLSLTAYYTKFRALTDLDAT